MISLLAGRFSVSSAIVVWGSSQATTTKPATFANPTDIAAGHAHALAIVSGGQVIGWGVNSFGQTTTPAGLTNAVAVAAGQSHSLALLANGRVIGWGDNSWGEIQPPDGVSNVTAIAAGGYHSLALRSNGTVVAWGCNEQGQTTVPVDLEGVKAIAAGKFYSLALCSNGTVRAWGNNEFGQINVPASLTNAIAIGAGYYHALAVTAEGRVVQWGSTSHEQGTPASLTNAVAVAGGLDYSLAIRQDGTLVHWGKALQLVINTNTAFQKLTAISCGHRYAMAFQNNKPCIYDDIGDLNAYAGSRVVLQPGVIGPNRGYLWYHNGQPLTASNAYPSLAFDPVTTNHAGQYQLVVTNAYGVATGRLAAIGVYPLGEPTPPIFTNSPAAITVHAGQTALFTAAAAGVQPMAYQWQRERVDIPGATSPTLELAGIEPNQAGWYRVIASNALGTAVSTQAYARVYERMAILDEPVSSTIYEGSKFLLHAKIFVATGAYSFHWRRDGQVVKSMNMSSSGSAFNSDLIYASATTEMAGSYDLMVSNSLGQIYSQTATVTIGDPSAPEFPGITQPPAHTVATPGNPALLPVQTIGAEPLTYQWQRDGFDVPDQTGRDLVFDRIQAIHFGDYRLIVSNQYGVVTSEVARLTFAAPPYFFMEPQDLRVSVWEYNYVVPSLIRFDARYVGSTPIASTWYCNGTNLTDSRFKVDLGGLTFNYHTDQLNKTWATEFSNSVFQCVISNAFGMATSRLARLQVSYYVPPQIQAPVVISPQEIQMSFNLQTGAFYTVQISTNLVNWSDWATFYGVSSATNFLWNTGTNQSSVYFRLLTPGPAP